MYGYQECLQKESGRLAGFTVYLSDGADQRISLPDVGPTDNFKETNPEVECNGFVFPNPLIYKGAIYQDNEDGFINGIRVLSDAGATDLGQAVGTPVLETFSQAAQLIGFYGSHNGQLIDTLGFLTHDPNCTAKLVEE